MPQYGKNKNIMLSVGSHIEEIACMIPFIQKARKGKSIEWLRVISGWLGLVVEMEVTERAEGIFLGDGNVLKLDCGGSLYSYAD